MTKRTALILGLAALAACACRKQADSGARLDTFPVRVAAVERRDVEESIILVGGIKAKSEAVLFSRVPGKLKENLLREGDSLRKGQAVALVERDEVGVRFEPAPVPSTLDGTVARLYLDRGAHVTPETPIALVVDQSEVIVRADVPERYAGRVALGQAARVRVDAYPGREFSGRIWRVSPVVDPATRSSVIEARLDNVSGRLRSGMFGELTLVTGRHARVASVPKEALSEEGGAAVFVVKDGRASRRRVKVGLRGDAYVEILEGVQPGEQAVVFGLYGLRDGSPVEILGGEKPAQPAPESK
ncbi:MAG: efflux RND transporter periplasmic adaptor subunit [Elusimicrobia bacterium]|nr:efflux RND transporter periplasmic adaptor subunit [Elusimicrobiota bacterium]